MQNFIIVLGHFKFFLSYLILSACAYIFFSLSLIFFEAFSINSNSPAYILFISSPSLALLSIISILSFLILSSSSCFIIFCWSSVKGFYLAYDSFLRSYNSASSYWSLLTMSIFTLGIISPHVKSIVKMSFVISNVL